MSPRARQILPAIGLALTLAACAGSQAPPALAFNPGEAEFARAPGRATVKGQMFLRRNDGVVVYGAGSEARLVPKTAHSNQVIAASFPGNKIRMHLILGIHSGAPLNFDPGLAPYVRSTRADGNGSFTFQQVPPGIYYVVGNVNWCAPGGYGTCDRQGGDLYETVIVRPTDTEVSAILSGS